MTEAVLRNQICPPPEMLGQISHLREVSAHYANVEISVLLDDTSYEVPPLHGFTLLDDQMIIIDAFNTGLTSQGRKDMERYRRVFDIFESQAVAIDSVLEKYESLYIDRLHQ